MYARAAVCLVVGPLCPHPHPCARTLPSLKYEPGEWELRWPSPRFGGRRGGGGVGGGGGGGGGGGSARSRINSSLLYQRLRPELKRLNLSEPQL